MMLVQNDTPFSDVSLSPLFFLLENHKTAELSAITKLEPGDSMDPI